MDGRVNSLEEIWAQSRHGAWASRGFRYQDAVTAFLMVKMWTGDLPALSIVPEGFDDVMFEGGEEAHLVQIKSKASSSPPFRSSDIAGFDSEILKRKDAVAGNGVQVRSTCLILERVPDQCIACDWNAFLARLPLGGSTTVFELPDPLGIATAELAKALDILPAAATIIFQVLCDKAGSIATENATRSFSERSKATPSDIDRLITDTLASIDPSALQSALKQQLCVPITFSAPLNDSNFYLGMDAQPGHVSAGLLIDRPQKSGDVEAALQRGRCVLLVGPSGAGKSGLQWISVHRMRHTVRWYRVTALAQLSDVASILQLLDALQPSANAPVGVVVDDVGRGRGDIWIMLEREASQRPGLLLLGSIRQEDVALVAGGTSSSFVQVDLDEALAEQVWSRLRENGITTQVHWRESYEQSKGLLLEYTHLLTSGERLATVIASQIARRQNEQRTTELAILRVCSYAAQYGAQIDATLLGNALDIDTEAMADANRRLLDEHLIREHRPGIIGGLHELRSRAVLIASHDEVAIRSDESAILASRCATAESLALLMHSMLKDRPGLQDRLINVLAERAKVPSSERTVAAAFTGLGMFTLQEFADRWIAILTEEALEPAHWGIATMMAAARTTLKSDDEDRTPAFKRIDRAVERLMSICVDDRRKRLVDALRTANISLTIEDTETCDALFCSLGPMAGLPAVPLDNLKLSIDLNAGIREYAELLQTVRAVDAETANKLAEQIGDEDTRLRQIFRNVPWITMPVVRADGEFSRAVCADFYAVTETLQASAHDRVVSLCDTLLAIIPAADGAIVRAVTSSGDELKYGEHRLASKRMPRSNVPPKVLQWWNQVFMTIVVARSATPSETVFATRMVELVHRGRVIFEKAVKALCRDKTELFIQRDLKEAYAIASDVNQYGVSHAPAINTSHRPIKGGVRFTDPVSALVAGLCGSLIPRMLRRSGDIGIAAFAIGLFEKPNEIRESPMWRLVDRPPYEDLDAIELEIRELRPLLGELIAVPDSYRRIVSRVRRELSANPLKLASRLSREAATERVAQQCRRAEAVLLRAGYHCEVTRLPLRKDDGHSWPPTSLVVFNHVASTHEFLTSTDRMLELVASLFPGEPEVYYLPVIRGHVIAQLAFQSYKGGLLPVADVDERWDALSQFPIFRSPLVAHFQAAVDGMIECAAIAAVRDLTALRKEEAEALDASQVRYRDALKTFEQMTQSITDGRVEVAGCLLAAMELSLIGKEEGLRHFPNLAVIPSAALRGEKNDQLLFITNAKLELVGYAAEQVGVS
ncbi:MAG: hypothetical protein ACJ8NR_00825 [Sulfurifustis sp.]